MINTTQVRRVLMGAAATTALLAGVSTPAAAAEFPEGVKFRIQNYQTKGCVSASVGLGQVQAQVIPEVDLCTAEHAVWVQGSGDSIRSVVRETNEPGVHWCLTGSDTGRVTTEPCNGSWNQKWTHYSEGFVKNWATKLCLDVKSESPNVVYTRGCLKHEWQKWAFKRI
ncbi:ricin-type beta-trefoil lectin domain protein [Streptomyces sp. NPDC090445]|uniref:ricin-type beta-trefoil lectin domain protein n=1 Tax=Streptomyces sp. NPDC090445 TaxID=3365963 RepID=UPI00381FDF48